MSDRMKDSHISGRPLTVYTDPKDPDNYKMYDSTKTPTTNPYQSPAIDSTPISKPSTNLAMIKDRSVNAVPVPMEGYFLITALNPNLSRSEIEVISNDENIQIVLDDGGNTPTKVSSWILDKRWSSTQFKGRVQIFSKDTKASVMLRES